MKHLTNTIYWVGWGQTFNNLNEIPLNSDDLIGQWAIGEFELNMHLISGVDQTISDYGQSFGYTPSQGGIFISGAINGQMHYANLGTVGWSQNYYGMAMLQISNNPVSYGAGNEDLEYPHYHFTYQYDGDSLESTLNLKTIVEGDTVSTVWFSNSAYDSAVLIDTVSNVVIIDSLILINTDSINSVLLSGQLAVNQIDIIAEESFTILSPFDVPQDYQNVFWDFLKMALELEFLKKWVTIITFGQIPYNLIGLQLEILFSSLIAHLLCNLSLQHS